MDTLVQLEERFDFIKAKAFCLKYWPCSIYFSIIYVVSIFSLQRWMKNREKYDLRAPLFLWSLALSVFSMAGFFVAGWRHLHYFYAHGWERSICDSMIKTGRPGLWSFLFCLSKFPELVDTYFIVLRKQKLIFLHWYHHITVFIYCWYSYAYIVHISQWFISMNYLVHSIMYTYFAIRASGHFRPPRWVSISITSLQLLQMVVGVYVNWYAYSRMKTDPNWYCDGDLEKSYFTVFLAFALYFSYFILFSHFFYASYIRKTKDPKLKLSETNSKTQMNGVLPHTTEGNLLIANGTVKSN